jgi:cytosine/adenosine deaminase-related metal-dependent hydrolase
LYRKFKADHLFTGYEILPGNNVLITDEEGTILNIINDKDASDNIEIFNGILTPGFVNCHCHLELSHMKGVVPPKTGLVAFLQQVMTRRTGSEEIKSAAMQKAEQELYNSGTVAVGDICNTTDSITIKEKSEIYWHNFIEVSGFVDAAAEKRFSDAKNILGKFQIPNSKFQNSLSPHAPYSVSKTLFELLNNETSKQLITIHNQESAAEDELYKNKTGDFLNLYKNFGIDISSFEPTGKSSLQSWFPYFTNNQTIILVHNTFMSQEDINFINLNTQHSTLNIFFCVCANANKYIEQKMPPIELLRNNNCNIVVGTDSYSSNWQLNILEEIKTIQQETDNTIPLQEVLQWATINGAKALQLQENFGSFEKGKQPGVILIDALNNLNLTNNSSAKRLI